MKGGTMRCCDMYVLSNSGAYGEHGPTTVGLAGHKSMALYSKMEAFRFKYDVVYTNICHLVPIEVMVLLKVFMLWNLVLMKWQKLLTLTQ